MKKTHGLSKTPVGQRWYAMISRCYNENTKTYKNYGGRGIKVCDEWREDVVAFHDYVMALPNAMGYQMTIDRIDNDGDYEPGNIRWASWHLQAANKRRYKDRDEYTGVYYVQGVKKFLSSISVHGELIYLGYHKTNKAAARARDIYIVQKGLIEYPLQTIRRVEKEEVTQTENK